VRMGERIKHRGRPSTANVLFEQARKVLLKNGPMTVTQLAEKLGVSPSTLKFHIYGQEKEYRGERRRYGGSWADKLAIVKFGRDPVVFVKLDEWDKEVRYRKKTTHIRVPSELHDKIKAVAEIEGRKQADVVEELFNLHSAADRRLWYAFKLVYSYAQLCLAVDLGDRFDVDVDEYERLFARVVDQVEGRLGVDVVDLRRNVPKLIESGGGRDKGAANDMVKAVVYQILTG